MIFFSQEMIEAIDRWIDAGVSPSYQEQRLALDWSRIGKISEELGEVTDALIGCTGQNPRKGYYSSLEAVTRELADVAWTAIFAIQHFTKDETETGRILVDRLDSIYRRIGNGSS